MICERLCEVGLTGDTTILPQLENIVRFQTSVISLGGDSYLLWNTYVEKKKGSHSLKVLEVTMDLLERLW